MASSHPDLRTPVGRRAHLHLRSVPRRPDRLGVRRSWWLLDVDGHSVRLSSAELLSLPYVREVIRHELGRVPAEVPARQSSWWNPWRRGGLAEQLLEEASS